MSETAIKSMQLYSHVDRIYNDLKELGVSATEPLSVDMLVPYDQLHYFGTDAVDEAIDYAKVNHDSRVLDVGSGLGGPARYLADKTGCHVTAVELQSDMHAVAQSLTQRCGLDKNVEHVCGDIHQTAIADNSYDVIVSWLAIYHIPQHDALYKRLRKSMKNDARIYFEDLYVDGEFNSQEQQEIDHLLYGSNIQTQNDYLQTLGQAGFDDILFDDQTNRWQPFVEERLSQFRQARKEKVRIHGEDTVDALDGFYEVVARLLKGGKLRGVRVTATAK